MSGALDRLLAEHTVTRAWLLRRGRRAPVDLRALNIPATGALRADYGNGQWVAEDGATVTRWVETISFSRRADGERDGMVLAGALSGRDDALAVVVTLQELREAATETAVAEHGISAVVVDAAQWRAAMEAAVMARGDG